MTRGKREFLRPRRTETQESGSKAQWPPVAYPMEKEKKICGRPGLGSRTIISMDVSDLPYFLAMPVCSVPVEIPCRIGRAPLYPARFSTFGSPRRMPRRRNAEVEEHEVSLVSCISPGKTRSRKKKKEKKKIEEKRRGRASLVWRRRGSRCLRPAALIILNLIGNPIVLVI